jgi:hypothetical protein
VGSISTSSSSLLFCSMCCLPPSMLRAFITHGIQTRVISSNAICRPLCLNAYQGGPLLLHAGYGSGTFALLLALVFCFCSLLY